MLLITMDPPQRDQELELAGRTLSDQAPERVLASGAVKPVLANGALPAMREVLARVSVKEEIVGYAVDLARRTREHAALLAGAGPRATQMLLLAARAKAALAGRDFAVPDDVKSMARPVLAHRLVMRPEYEIEGLTCAEVVDEVLDSVPVPR
ncbi:MAG: hypothetical protein JRI97_12910 [Deltaproteobacteria bacterium]|nr:hypothetical protein [Deltaproteobacteria bacterium]